MPQYTMEDIFDLALAAVGEDVPAGDKPAATLARRIGLNYQRVYRWLEAPRGTDADGMLALLQGLGWLSIPEDVRERAGLPPDPLAKLAEAVVEIGETQKEILRRLPAPGGVQASAAQGGPRRKKN